jgi:hypothetical protein
VYFYRRQIEYHMIASYLHRAILVEPIHLGDTICPTLYINKFYLHQSNQEQLNFQQPIRQMLVAVGS